MTESRIAVLEEKSRADSDKIAAIESKIDATYTKVSSIETTLNKQKGFISGAMFVLIPLWSVIVALSVTAWDWISSGGAGGGQ